MRYWNTRELTERENKLADVWSSIHDDVDRYLGTRLLLIDAVEDLVVSLKDTNFGDLKQITGRIGEITENPPVEQLDEIIGDLEEVLSEFEDIDEDRETLNEAFQSTIELDTDPIFDGLDDWWIDDKTVDELQSRIYSQAAIQADVRLFEDISDASTMNELNTIRSSLASESTIANYSGELVEFIGQHLTSSDSYTDDHLRSIIQELFAELQSRGWRDDDLQKVLAQYITSDDAESSQEQILQKIAENTAPQLCHVALPDAHLGGLTPLDAGEVTFHALSDPDFDIQSRQHPATASMEFADQADVWASAEVVGATQDIKTRRLKEKVGRAVDVLNLGKKAGILSFPFDESYTVLQETSGGQVLPLKRSHDLSRVPFSEIASKSDIESRIEHFSDYLDGAIETPLEVALANSIRWYRYANRSPEEEEQFLKYIISIESLLVEGKTESKQDTIAERAVNILQLHEGVRPDQEELFASMYDIRSEIVHSGARNLHAFEHQLAKLERRAALLISTVEQYTDDCDSIAEVVRQIHDEEAELKAERIEDSPTEVGESFNVEAILTTGGGSELATLQLDGHFVDDGRYVYYDAQIDDGDFRSGISLSSDMKYRIQFELDGTTWTGFDVTFPEQDILEGFPTDLPGKIRWYRVEIQDTD